MKTECFRYFKDPAYWAVPGLGLAARAALAWLDRLHRAAQFWELAADFWNKTGSITLGSLILLVMIRRFSYDTQSGAFPLINSAAHGRLALFRDRLAGGETAVLGAALLLYAGNMGISGLFGGAMPRGWVGTFTLAEAAVLAGAGGYFAVSAMVCDLTRNHPIAMCLCGLPFACSYFINAGAVRPPELLWFVRYGFFTELMRGRAIRAYPIFWAVWYPALMGLVFFLVIRRRKERREL